MVKKKSVTAAGSSTTGGAAAKSSSTLPKKSSSDAHPSAPAPPGSIAKPGDWQASSITKRDEKRARSLGLVSPDEGNVILPGQPELAAAKSARRELRGRRRQDELPLDTPLDAHLGCVDSPLPRREPAVPQTPPTAAAGQPELAAAKSARRELRGRRRQDELPLDTPLDAHLGCVDSPLPRREPAVPQTPPTAAAGKPLEHPPVVFVFFRACVVERTTTSRSVFRTASPGSPQRSTGGFADEDDLFDIDEGFVEPPAKKAKSGVVLPNVAASEVLVPKAAPAAQVSTASSLSKGKDAPSTSVTNTPPSDLRGVISSLEAFASQFTSLEAEKVRLQKEVKSSSSKLDGAVKIAAEARQEVDSLKEELGKLKEKLKKEEATRLPAEAWAAEKDELLRQSSLALLEAANIPTNALDKIPNNSPANGLSMTLASHQLTRELLEKGKGAMARIH
ncbi:hypothetical protein QYE76_043270 [Lolium multiflorum]|uniref:Uncharacterized protein n=1 Tax=Lolium multiflorum TaxID=4521 RepID=A0AAD8TIE7_LOLMU|nr:hypothetical protein QYE76_043270 [Lolium multiflorum]